MKALSSMLESVSLRQGTSLQSGVALLSRLRFAPPWWPAR